MKTQKNEPLKLNTCGKHWGKGGNCSKCGVIANDSREKANALAFYNATFYPPKTN